MSPPFHGWAAGVCMTMICIIYLQLTAGLDRAIGRLMSQELWEGWEGTLPKDIAIAEEETDNATILALAPARSLHG